MQWTLKTFDIQELKPYDKNPRTFSEKQHRTLSKLLEEFGLIDKPILNADKTIIGGHQRIEVLKAEGMDRIECWIPDRMLKEEEVAKLNIGLNMGGDWDYDLLANVFDVGDLLDWGFDEDDLGLGKAEKKKKVEKAIISLEFSDKDTMLEYLQKCEQIATESSAKMKVRG